MKQERTRAVGSSAWLGGGSLHVMPKLLALEQLALAFRQFAQVVLTGSTLTSLERRIFSNQLLILRGDLLIQRNLIRIYFNEFRIFVLERRMAFLKFRMFLLEVCHKGDVASPPNDPSSPTNTLGEKPGRDGGNP